MKLCAGAAANGLDLWCSDDPAEREAAKLICNQCTEAPSCLRGALERGEKHHVWGGLDLGVVDMAEPAWELPAIEPVHGSRAAYMRCTDGDDGHACAACRTANAAYQAGYRDHGPAVTRPAVMDVFEQLTIGAMA